ncbi:MAG: aspartyl/asparaginyl beta-hydroxylase domain-containing protein [Steroidobacteraceae bacterium]
MALLVAPSLGSCAGLGQNDPMLELHGQPVLDKLALIGACLRLPVHFDAARLAGEVDALPASAWGTTGGRVGVHLVAESVFLRGYAPAEGNRPIEDRPALSLLPYVREIIESGIPAPVMRSLLARLPAGACIAPHVDRAPYFSQTVRLHIAVTSHERAYMLCAGQCYVMRPGELWALNNSLVHGVWNADRIRSRTHLICDFLPTPALEALLRSGERNLGIHRPDVEEQLAHSAHPRAIN